MPNETEWLEFKADNSDAESIGEYISALSNSAALHNKVNGYLIWGIKDDTHEIIGTTFDPQSTKVGGEELENWLLRLLSPKIDFYFNKVVIDGKPILVLEIDCAARHPVQFKNMEYIRVGSYKKKLKDFPEKERELWRLFDKTPFEAGFAAHDISTDDVLKLLDYPAYFDLLNQPLPDNKDGIILALAAEEFILKNDAGKWNLTNYGAILFAKSLSEFKSLSRKAVRVVVYKKSNKTETEREQVGSKGYASGFKGLIGFVTNLYPENEVIIKALRKKVPTFPELAVRELIANALIHQDFSVTGAGPMVDIFPDRMEITNPGVPLVQTDRFLDSPPRSRNEKIAAFMRRIGVCEERGSGIDKVVFQTELYQLPAPLFDAVGDNTRCTLFAPKQLRDMEKQDRTRACYLHACLKYVARDFMTNASLRERFGIEDQNSATASRIIKDTIDENLIKPNDPETGTRWMKYVPFWA